MKKKVAKIFKKYGEGKIELIKDFHARTFPKGKTTVAIKGSLLDINRAIGNCMLKGAKSEIKLLGETLTGKFYEDKDFESKELIKY